MTNRYTQSIAIRSFRTTVWALVNLGVVVLTAVASVGAQTTTEKPAYSVVPRWSVKDLQHEYVNQEVFVSNGFIYTGGGGTTGNISKVNLKTGAIAWSYPTGQTYQPSYPVSNGHVVIFGTYHGEPLDSAPYHRTYFVGLDDVKGTLLWKVPAEQQNMSAACFAGDLAFIGSYDRNLYAIDWAKGEIRWKSPLGSRVWSTPCVYGDLVIVGCDDGNLYCIDRATGKLESKIDCGGRVKSDLVISNGLLFALSDNQNDSNEHDTAKEQKNMLVVDMRQRKIIDKFSSENHFYKKVIVSGKDIYFFDWTYLYAYDSKRAKLSWKIKAPEAMAPYPILTPSKIILAMNDMGYHGDHTSKTFVIERSTGKKLLEQDTGGIGIRRPHFAQSDDIIVTFNWGLVGYKITPAG